MAQIVIGIIFIYAIFYGHIFEAVWCRPKPTQSPFDRSNHFLDDVLYSRFRKHILGFQIDPFPLAGFIKEINLSDLKNVSDSPSCVARFQNGEFTGFSRTQRYENCSIPVRYHSWSNNVSVTCNLVFNDLSAKYDLEIRHDILHQPLLSKVVCDFSPSLVAVEMTHDPFGYHQPDVSSLYIKQMGKVNVNGLESTSRCASSIEESLMEACRREFKNILKYTFRNVLRESLKDTMLPRSSTR